MTQFSCPLCGKNSSITNYVPDSLQLDLIEVSFGSYGRGGIYIASRESILGEGTNIENQLAKKSLDLTKMFRDNGSLTDIEIMERLDLFKYLKPVYIKNESTNLDISIELYNLKKNKKKEEKDKEILLYISKSTKSKFSFNKKNELILYIYEIFDCNALIRFFLKKKISERVRIKKMLRIKPDLENFFEILINFPEFKSGFQKIYEGTYNPLWDDPVNGINTIIFESRFGRDEPKEELVPTYYTRPNK